jgi:hypothetical protein
MICEQPKEFCTKRGIAPKATGALDGEVLLRRGEVSESDRDTRRVGREVSGDAIGRFRAVGPKDVIGKTIIGTLIGKSPHLLDD